LDALYASYQVYMKTLGLAQSALKQANETFERGEYLKALIKVFEAMTYLDISNITYSKMMSVWKVVKAQVISLSYNVPALQVIKQVCKVKFKDWNSEIVITVLDKCLKTGSQGVKLVKILKPYGGLEAFAGSLVIKDLKDFGKSIEKFAPRQSKILEQAKELKEEIELVLSG